MLVFPPLRSLRSPVDMTYTANAVSASVLTTYTFSSQSIGTAAANRYVIVGVTGGDSTRTVSTLTVGGVSASLVVRQQATARTAEIWIAAVPTGTTADVVVTWSGSQNTGTGIGVWAATSINPTAYDTGGDTTPSDPMTDTLNVVSGGAVVGICHAQNFPTLSWTNITTDFEANISGGADHSGGSLDDLTAGTLVVQANDTATNSVMACASFQGV